VVGPGGFERDWEGRTKNGDARENGRDGDERDGIEVDKNANTKGTQKTSMDERIDKR